MREEYDLHGAERGAVVNESGKLRQRNLLMNPAASSMPVPEDAAWYTAGASD